MKKELYQSLNSLAETFQYNAPKDNETFPSIVFYSIITTSKISGDNGKFNKKGWNVSINIFDTTENDELYGKVEEIITDFQGIINSENDEIDESEGIQVFVKRFDVEFPL